MYLFLSLETVLNLDLIELVNVHIRLSSQNLSRCYDFLERGLDCKLDKPTCFLSDISLSHCLAVAIQCRHVGTEGQVGRSPNTPSRTSRISGLKSQVLKPTFLNYK